MTKKTTTLPSTYFRNDMKSGQILVMIGIIIIGIGLVLTTLVSFIGLIIMGVGIYQYSVAKRRYNNTTILRQRNDNDDDDDDNT